MGLSVYEGSPITFLCFNTGFHTKGFNFRGEMEGNKQKGISLSFTSEFFGSIKESHLPPPLSAGGIFGSIFSPLSSKTKVCFSFQHLDFCFDSSAF